MSNSFLITTIILVILALSALVGYNIRRTSKRAGAAIGTAGLLSGLMLAINYFEELPLVIVAAGFVAIGGSIVYALFDAILRE